MAQPSTTQVYEVYLAADVADELGVETPVETEHIDYYDAGIWVTTDSGREFYPYEHVLTIRERPAAQEAVVAGAGGETETEGAGEDVEF